MLPIFSTSPLASTTSPSISKSWNLTEEEPQLRTRIFMTTSRGAGPAQESETGSEQTRTVNDIGKVAADETHPTAVRPPDRPVLGSVAKRPMVTKPRTTAEIPPEPAPEPRPARRFTDTAAGQTTILRAGLRIVGPLSGKDSVDLGGSLEGDSEIEGLFRVPA